MAHQVPGPPISGEQSYLPVWWLGRFFFFLLGMGTAAGAAYAIARGMIAPPWALFIAAAGIALAALQLRDKPYWVFLAQNPIVTAGYFQEVHTFTKAVGVTFSNKDGSFRPAIIRRLQPGEQLLFIWDRWNGYSTHAIAILRFNGEQIGYMRDEMAADFCPHVKRGVAFGVWVNRVTGGGRLHMGVNIDIEEVHPGASEAGQVRTAASRATWIWRNRLPNTVCRCLFALAVVAAAFGGVQMFVSARPAQAWVPPNSQPFVRPHAPRAILSAVEATPPPVTKPEHDSDDRTPAPVPPLIEAPPAPPPTYPTSPVQPTVPKPKPKPAPSSGPMGGG